MFAYTCREDIINLMREAGYKIPKALIYLNFRFIKKGQYWYWREEVRQGRRLRSSHGWLLPWHIQHQGASKHAHSNTVLLCVPEGWAQVKVARNCNVELPPVLTYKTSRLLDRRSGWLVVAYTKHAAKTAVFILMDVYDNLRLWRLPTALIEGIRRLPLLLILGNRANVQELLRILRVIETTELDKLPATWRHRTRRKDGKEFSPGRRAVLTGSTTILDTARRSTKLLLRNLCLGHF